MFLMLLSYLQYVYLCLFSFFFINFYLSKLNKYKQYINYFNKKKECMGASTLKYISKEDHILQNMYFLCLKYKVVFNFMLKLTSIDKEKANKKMVSQYEEFRERVGFQGTKL